ncbi:MAG: hypothetical protein ACP5QR_13985 [Rhizomicrobium sp.]
MGKFGAIKSVRQESRPPETTKLEGVTVEVKPQPTLVSRGRPPGKRSNPEFEPTTIFLRKTTKKIANRTLEDRGDPQDLSELIEELLQGWISERA